ncbi:chromate transporter [Clostridium butyricum]|uniref:Chromate transporter n=2 Tax=Clostridium butyricum TaxID=1492 RepID=A0A2S7FAX5_CLOBU|nr:chromate transporter [Clostridium butyricum]PPV15013.1 chromate transporter [Clostridium butyricum]
MIYLLLFFEFFKTGLFAVGGGLATLPFLINLTYKYDWFNQSMLADMIAVSESTPGPMGVNISTYAGYSSGGISGGIVATLGLITPSIIIIIVIAKFLEKFKTNKSVESVFECLRPASVGLIGVAAFEVVKIALLNINEYLVTNNLLDLLNIKSCILFVIIFYSIIKYKKHPIVYIGISAVIGIIFGIRIYFYYY